MKSVYQDALRDLMTKLSGYRNRQMPIGELQQSVWNAAMQIESVEENRLRRFLQKAEAKLDEAKYLYESKELFDQSLKLVEEIEEELWKWFDARGREGDYPACGPMK